jgi:hypothetical protein
LTHTSATCSATWLGERELGGASHHVRESLDREFLLLGAGNHVHVRGHRFLEAFAGGDGNKGGDRRDAGFLHDSNGE